MAAPKVNKNQLRRARKKAVRVESAAAKTQNADATPTKDVTPEDAATTSAAASGSETKKPVAVAATAAEGAGDETGDTDYEKFDLDLEDPAFAQFKEVFRRFGSTLTGDGKDAGGGAADSKGDVFYGDDDDIPSEDDDEADGGNSGAPKLSKKKRKLLSKLSVAELKTLVGVPEVVEWYDVSSSDPRLLVQIKAHRNVVPVPGHWILKREYLSSKRGIEKPPFRLPKFIAETGITEMRDAVLEKQEQQTLKQRQRERVAPKMGRLDIDYQKLYDAFFRFQSKPDLTRFGEVYYEGKETEVDFKSYRPGELSEAAREALGMAPGYPPPWLINQQRLGPPPSYPTLKIPGLNAPPPPGGAWGFHPGGYGKPSVDEFNRPLYGGDVFGLGAQQQSGGAAAGLETAAASADMAAPLALGEPVERTFWGELQPREEESEEEEDEDEEDEDEDEDEDVKADQDMSGVGGDGLETPAGYTSTMPADFPGHGVETSVAGELDLRKARRGFETEESAHPRTAYTVLQEKQSRIDGFFGSERTYDIKGATGAGVPVLGQEDDSRKRKKPGDIDASIDIDSLQRNDGLIKEELRRKFEEGRRETGPGAQWSSVYDEDLSEMIAQESRKRQKVEEKSREKKKEGKYQF